MDSGGLDALLASARRRDPDALRGLVDAYAPRVFGLVFRLTGSRDAAEELVQETFLRVVRTIEEYEHAGKFEAWLFRIASNLARDVARQKKRRRPTSSLDAGPDEYGSSGISDKGAADPRGGLVGVEDRERLAECLDRLSEVDREILLLRHYSDLSFQEIAELLKIPLGTALARAHRALAKLRGDFESADARSAAGDEN